MAIQLSIKNNKTFIEGATSSELNLISSYCTYEYEYYGMDFSQRPPRPGRKEATINYFDWQTHSFPSGWVGKVFQGLRDEGVEVHWSDDRVKPAPDPESWLIEPLWELREDYQLPAADLAMEKTRGILHHATGAGKTVLMFHLAERIRRKTLILVPDRNLLYQAYEGLEDDDKGFIDFFGEDKVGFIGDGTFKDGDIVIATVPSMWSGLKKREPEIMKILEEVDAVFVDEAHHINIAGKNKIKNSYFQVIQACNAFYRFAFTATPGEEGSLERGLLEAATGRVIHRVSSTYLIEKGYLTRPDIYLYPIEGLKRIRDWNTAYKKNILFNEHRNRTIVNIAKSLNDQGKSVLIIVKRVEDHGKQLVEMVPEAEFMSGKTDSEDRKDMMQRFAKKDLKTLISTVIKEGTNIPSMDAIIIAAGGKSAKAITQWIGRALRKSKGKSKAVIIDFIDEDKGMLKGHSNKRIKTYEKEDAFNIIYVEPGKFKQVDLFKKD